MKRLIIIFLSCFLLTGCSLLPRVTFDSPNTVPQSVNKSKAKNVCKGEAKFDSLGNITYCSKGFYLYEEGYNKEERRMTIVERIKSFINNLAGWSFWIFIALIIFCPSAIGFIVGRILEGATGIASTVGKRLMKAIQKTRKENKDLNQSLEAELDEKDKQYIAKVKEKEKIK